MVSHVIHDLKRAACHPTPTCCIPEKTLQWKEEIDPPRTEKLVSHLFCLIMGICPTNWVAGNWVKHLCNNCRDFFLFFIIFYYFYFLFILLLFFILFIFYFSLLFFILASTVYLLVRMKIVSFSFYFIDIQNHHNSIWRSAKVSR